MSWYFVTQSISRATLSRLPVSTARTVRSHRSSTRRTTGSAPRRSTKSRALSRYSDWISSELASRPLASRTLRRPVMSWLTSRIARMGFSSVRSRITTPASTPAHQRAGPPRLDHAQHQVGRADLEQHGRLAHVGVADDDVQPAEPLRVGVRLVARVNDRAAAGRRGADALPDVLGPLAHAEHRTPGGLQHLPCAADDLTGHEERDEYVGEAREL